MNNHSQTKRRETSPVIMMLLVQLYNQFEKLDVKPPVTLFLVASNIYIHLFPVFLPFINGEIGNIKNNCLNPKEISKTLSKCFLGSSGYSFGENIMGYFGIQNRNHPCLEIAWNRLILSGMLFIIHFTCKIC